MNSEWHCPTTPQTAGLPTAEEVQARARGRGRRPRRRRKRPPPRSRARRMAKRKARGGGGQMTECAVRSRSREGRRLYGLGLRRPRRPAGFSPPDPAVSAVVVRDARSSAGVQHGAVRHAEVTALRDAARVEKALRARRSTRRSSHMLAHAGLCACDRRAQDRPRRDVGRRPEPPVGRGGV